MPSALHNRFVPLDEYFTLDTEGTAERWEWRNGEVFCMTGAQPEHNLICINVGAELRTRLRGSGCLTFTSDQRVKVRAGSPYLYPDLSVACAPKYVTINGLRTLLNPVLIVEVLSPSTAQDDQGSKFMQYQSIDSLAGYLLVDFEIRGSRIADIAIPDLRVEASELADHLTFTIEDSRTETDSILIHAELDPLSMNLGNFNILVTVHTGLQNMEELEVYLTGSVTGPFVIEPNRLYFGRFIPGETYQQRVSIKRNDDQPLRIVSATATPDVFSVELPSDDPASEQTLIVHFNPGTSSEQRFRGSVTVHTDSLDYSDTEILLFAFRQIEK